MVIPSKNINDTEVYLPLLDIYHAEFRHWTIQHQSTLNLFRLLHGHCQLPDLGMSSSLESKSRGKFLVKLIFLLMIQFPKPPPGCCGIGGGKEQHRVTRGEKPSLAVGKVQSPQTHEEYLLLWEKYSTLMTHFPFPCYSLMGRR